MGNTWHALINLSSLVLIEKLRARFPFHPLKDRGCRGGPNITAKLPQTLQSCS